MSATKRKGTQADGGSPRSAKNGGAAERRLAWPGDPEGVSASDIDFEALAHVLANTCRHGGRTRQYHALAAHAVIVSEEVEALDGLGETDRRRLALHALLAPAPSAWLRGLPADSQRAAERTSRLAAGIERAVREAAGLEAPDEEEAELLRFVARMTAAAEHRDLADLPGDDGAAFPPLRRRIRAVGPARAAKLWLARFRALASPPSHAGETAGDGHATRRTDEEDSHVAHVPQTEGMEGTATAGEESDAGQAA